MARECHRYERWARANGDLNGRPVFSQPTHSTWRVWPGSTSAVPF